MTSPNGILEKSVNTLRFLSADAVQEANSGHPGLPMGAAAIAYTLWTRHLSHYPKNPSWANRDRFVLSGGHGSMLLYSLLHLTGYDLPLEEIKNFRQWESLTPGHPEYGLTPGVETTTGPLGQGFANGVGFAIAEAHLAALYNKPEFPIIDHHTYAIVTDGDLMEGVASEAASLAGHLQLGKLIYFYDSNQISIDGSTELAFTEDRSARFEAYGWQVLQVEDGNDVAVIDRAIQTAKQDPRPSLIVCRTHIGYGLPTKQDTEEAHGSPPGDAELNVAKERLDYPVEPRFFIDPAVLAHFREAVDRGKKQQAEWEKSFKNYQEAYPREGAELKRRLEGKLPEDWQSSLPEFPADQQGLATRAASGKVINAIASQVPELIGGSADLTPSNKTWIEGSPDFQAGQYQGRNFHFGVREHAMGSIVNGMAIHGGVIPYGGTFLVFSDYMRPAVRLSALSHMPSIWIYTHDSIGVGEDGPTHQPVEHLAALRVIPNLITIRPGDANEVVTAWKVAVERRSGPTALALSRQSMPTLDRTLYQDPAGLEQGAYILKDYGEEVPDIILMASGSEVGLIAEAGELLAEKGIHARLVSFPSWELFREQDAAYQEVVLPPGVSLRIAVEAGVPLGWREWVGDKGAVIGIQQYGASAPGGKVMDEYGFTADRVVKAALDMINQEGS